MVLDICMISKLKEKLLLTENELNETKHKLNTYQINSKKYYENNKDKIIDTIIENQIILLMFLDSLINYIKYLRW